MFTELKKVRLKKGIKQCRLSKEAKVSLSNISRYENDWAVPRYDTALKIARVLQCSVKEIFPNLEVWEDFE